VEERLGVKLLTRTAHQLSPTPQELATMAGSLQRELCR
jgi:DNA-binding transcriptional LysR family regulator